MERSLSVLLPVHNAQTTLENSVARMLDVLPELTRRFDVLIIDDGSTDHTMEVAHDLALRFPQVRLARHSERRGLGQAIRTGLERTRGDIVFVHDSHPDIEPADLPKLWRVGFEREVLMARRLAPPQGNRREAWLTRLLTWAKDGLNRDATKLETSGFHVFRRESLEGLRDAAISAANIGGATSARQGKTRADRPAAGRIEPARPNYLERLKRFAMEE